MKNKLVKILMLAVVCGAIAVNADAQRRSRTRANSGATQKPANNTQQQQQQNNNAQPKYNPYGNTPIEVAPQVGGFNDSIKKSMRNDGAVERSAFKDRIPLPYENLRADDALFMERVWREIDIREKINQPFGFKSDDDNGSQRFVNIMVNAVRSGKVTAFNADDDRFTTPLDSVQFEKVITGGAQCDTLPVYNLNDPTKIDKYVVTCNTLNPDQVVKFRIKEDWVFDREASRMFCRIIRIAPCKTIMSVDQKTERGATPLFWIYYPDLRETLAKAEVYNPKNMGMNRLTWEELFETRMFGSYILKSTIDNAQNRPIRNYIKDPILALLEGDNIKNKIFDYEQNLWSY